MTRPLQIALLDRACSPAVIELAAALNGAGQVATVMTPAPPLVAVAGVRYARLQRLPDAPLRLRKIGDGLSHLPAAWLALARGKFDVAHAFTPSDALAAVGWGRRTGRPTVFTCAEPPTRQQLAARRLRLQAWRCAVEGSSAVLAVDEEISRELRRWLAVAAPVVTPGEAQAHLAIYSGSLSGRSAAQARIAINGSNEAR